MEKVVLSHHSLFYYLVVLSTFICASPSLVGGFFSKIAIIILISINIYFFKINRYVYLSIFFISSVFIIKYLVAIASEGYNVDLYPLVLMLHLYFLVTYPFGNKLYFNAVKLGVELCFYFGFIASFISLVLGKSVFIFSLANKGLPNIYAFEGFTTTPQAFASLAILVLMFNYNSIKGVFRRYLPFIGLLLSINRTILLGGMLVFFYRFLFLFIPIIALSFFFLELFSFETKLFTLQTISSRIDMLVNISSNFFSMDISSIIFGTFMSPNFEVHSAGTKYIENGIMFILYYFGLVGFIAYSIFVGFLLFSSIKLKFYSKAKILIYFILVTTIVPMLTHEFLYISFYVSIIFFIEQVYFLNNTKR